MGAKGLVRDDSYSKSDLARRVGVSPTAVHNWEENGVEPRLSMFLALEKVLEVSWVQLKRGDEDLGGGPTDDEPSRDLPPLSRGERLDQFRRQIAALFEVPADRVEIIVRT